LEGWGTGWGPERIPSCKREGGFSGKVCSGGKKVGKKRVQKPLFWKKGPHPKKKKRKVFFCKHV